MFPTTQWTHIQHAGAQDPAALEDFARRYRGAVLGYLRSRGCGPDEAEELTQEVFVRLLEGDVLARADGAKGRFRHLLQAVTRHSLLDQRRRREVRDRGKRAIESAPEQHLATAGETDDLFDREWMRQLTANAMAFLAEDNPRFFGVLRDHLDGRSVDRNKLWMARKKLANAVRREVANTCGSPEECREELEHLAPFIETRRERGEG